MPEFTYTRLIRSQDGKVITRQIKETKKFESVDQLYRHWHRLGWDVKDSSVFSREVE